jgi:hypothetical protein
MTLMTSPRSRTFRSIAILLLIAGMVSLQAASQLSSHSTDHATHCCGVCHVSHVAMVTSAQALSVLAPIVTARHIPVEESSDYLEMLTAAGHSRAPPA